jgi:hypothetical protein
MLGNDGYGKASTVKQNSFLALELTKHETTLSD